MADASSAPLTTIAAQLREAAKQTMRRKQAPAARSVVPKTRNGTTISSSSQPSSVGSSATPSPAKQPPKGPRGVPTLSTTNVVPLNYGDANQSSTVDEPTFSGSARPSAPAREQQPRRKSARASAAKGKEVLEGGVNREEGEISDEEMRAKRLQEGNLNQSEQSATTPPADHAPVQPPDLISVAISASTSVPLGLTESTNDADASAKGAVRKSSRTRLDTTKPAPMIATTTSNNTKRPSISAGMQPPPPPATIHREPPPISPTASMPAIKPQFSTRSLRSESKVKLPPPPSLETHSFEGLVKEGTEDSAIEISDDDDNEDEDMGGISPKTTQLNQQVFTQLLKMGIDEDNCRPGLPMTFQQFNDAKGLILDLLGYGMTPEDIADIRIDRRLLVYCLRELKIRLPANVPVEDIISFSPPVDLLPDDSNGDSELPSRAHSPQNDDLQSEHSMEITPVDGLIVERVSKSPSLPRSPPPPPVKSESPVNQPQKLNPNAEPFLPAKPPPQITTGPSLFAMALPHQQIPPLPVRESIPTSLPSSLPPRPHFSYDAASSRRSTAGSSSAGTVTAFTALKIDTEMEHPPQQDNALLKKLEQEKRLLLRETLLQLKKEGGLPSSTSERRDSTPPTLSTGNPVPDTETQHKPSILGGQRVGSPSPMDVDEPSNSKPEPKVAVPNPVVMPKRPPVQLRATLNRALHSLESTRPSTPSDNGPKRGVKRPKADDFVEENMPAKKSARLNGAANLPPLKRSSFAIANSAAPEQHIITWIDDEAVEISPTPWNQPKDHSGVNGARDSEAAQLAAAAMALGLPMTAEELDAARLQEEERKAQLNAKTEKLLRTQANLKRLELKKAEKSLQNLQSAEDQSANSKEVIQAQEVVLSLKSELESIQAKLRSPKQPQAEKPGPSDTLTMESVPDVSTFDLPVTNSEPSPMQEQVPEEPEAAVDSTPSVSPENGYHLALWAPSYTDSSAEDSDMLKDDDSEVDVVLDGTSEATTDLDRPQEGDDLDELDAAHDYLHHGAASQSRLTKYSPPLMLSVLTAHQPSRDQVTYSRGEDDESSRTTDHMQLNTPAPSSLVDPNGVLCQFESGGGVCRDPGCQDLHFKDFQA